MSAFIRAQKPARVAKTCCAPTCCAWRAHYGEEKRAGLKARLYEQVVGDLGS